MRGLPVFFVSVAPVRIRRIPCPTTLDSTNSRYANCCSLRTEATTDRYTARPVIPTLANDRCPVLRLKLQYEVCHGHCIGMANQDVAPNPGRRDHKHAGQALQQADRAGEFSPLPGSGNVWPRRLYHGGQQAIVPLPAGSPTLVSVALTSAPWGSYDCLRTCCAPRAPTRCSVVQHSLIAHVMSRFQFNLTRFMSRSHNLSETTIDQSFDTGPWSGFLALVVAVTPFAWLHNYH
ncbi:uncharacterized protein BDV17DRAFT_258598 [Aspergillus undulatus]|uniref:uncharacterized protein n=1 Tax=Aspergillus undulatus TaxID=1810928 RepID=UPI003CCDAD35